MYVVRRACLPEPHVWMWLRESWPSIVMRATLCRVYTAVHSCLALTCCMLWYTHTKCVVYQGQPKRATAIQVRSASDL